MPQRGGRLGPNGDATRQLITLVNLRHDAEHPQVSRRFDLVTEALREVMADVVEVRAPGEGDLAQLLDLALVGDMVALELACHEGVDPGPVPVVDDIKPSWPPATAERRGTGGSAVRRARRPGPLGLRCPTAPQSAHRAQHRLHPCFGWMTQGELWGEQ